MANAICTPAGHDRTADHDDRRHDDRHSGYDHSDADYDNHAEYDNRRDTDHFDRDERDTGERDPVDPSWHHRAARPPHGDERLQARPES
jgi:hypothetical protein